MLKWYIVAASNQEKALVVGAFSNITQLCRLIIYSTIEYYDDALLTSKVAMCALTTWLVLWRAGSSLLATLHTTRRPQESRSGSTKM